MISLAAWLVTSIVIVYLFLGFPLLLSVLSRLFRYGHHMDERIEPSVTLIISAYNEQDVIRDKLENSLGLDYPTDKLDILVVSDCSDDNTDAIVNEYQDRGVRLLRTSARRGKTAGLNEALATIDTDLVVFSDANAIYDAAAIRKLVRHFADSSVGYAVGYARYDDSSTSAGESEGLYWNYEVRLKQAESDFYSVVGGDGALYMIRRDLYQTMEVTDINDFVNPLQIVAAGYRGIFDPEAQCLEQAAGDFEKEFGRKVRIVNRSLNGLLRVPQLLNPLKFPRFCWLLTSHKLLRWFSPLVIALHFALSVALASTESGLLPGRLVLGCYAVLTLLALLGNVFSHKGKDSGRLFYLPYYFVLMNAASAYGIIKRLTGEQITTWSTVRGQDSGQKVGELLTFIVSGLILILSLLIIFLPTALLHQILSIAIVAIGIVLVYTYVGYPIVLFLLRPLFSRPHQPDEAYLPSVTILIAAYNEGAVIGEKMENSLALDYPSELLRIVVASDGSSDNTNAIVERFSDPKITLLALSPNRGKVTALNEAIEQIDSDIVILSDANVMYQTDSIKKMMSHFADPTVGAVSGKVVLVNEHLSYAEAENRYYSIEHFIQRAEGQTGSMIGSDGAMYALRRELYPYPAADTILDDFVISMSVVKQGYRLVHAPDVLGFERNEQEMTGEYKRKVRIVAGGIQCLLRKDILPPVRHGLTWFKMVSHKILRWLCGPLIAILVLLIVYAVLLKAELSLLAWFTVYAVVFCALLEAVSLLSSGLRRYRLFALVHYLTVMHVASIQGCWRGVLGNQSVTWKRT